MRRIFILLLTLSTGCIENFNPEIDEQKTDLYVIQGSISDINPTFVLIQKTVPFGSEDGEIETIEDATVILHDNLSNQEVLQLQSDGSYTGTSPGTIGRSYSIEIQLTNGEVITSAPETLKPGAGVGALSKEDGVRYKISSVGENLPIRGIDINLYMNESDTLSGFYRWTFTQTYEIRTPYDVNGPPCYITSPIPYYFILGESVSTDKDLLSKNLQFFTGGEKFAFGYSLEVVQHALPIEAYEYWKKIEDQQKNVGSIFDAPPAQIKGNLSLVEAENTPVLGYFEVASITTKRIFIEPTDFRVKPEPIWIACFPDPPTIPVPAWCSDCTARNNSTRDVPPFWPN